LFSILPYERKISNDFNRSSVRSFDKLRTGTEEAVDLEVSKAILALTDCITDTFRLVFGPSLEHYRILFRGLQEKGHGTYLETIRGDAAEICKGLRDAGSTQPCLIPRQK